MSEFLKRTSAIVGCLMLLLGALAPFSTHAETVVQPKVTLHDGSVSDQDDMCFWLHPDDPARSTVITSDKHAGKLFVYDLAGNTVQVVPVDGKPGNIDLRYGFPLGDQRIDIVAFNDRDHSAIQVYAVDPATRRLSRVDNGAIQTGPNYGFALYRSPDSGTFYAFIVSNSEEDPQAEQYELADDGAGRIRGTKVRSWDLGLSEGCVADDETGQLYICEEGKGIWRIGAEPKDPTPGNLIVPLGPNDFVADAEGVTLCYGPDGGGYIVASSQGNSQYKVYQRKPPHAFVKTFTVAGAANTDGIDLLAEDLGPAFPHGVFALHNGKTGTCPVLLCGLEDLGLDISLGIRNPRTN